MTSTPNIYTKTQVDSLLTGKVSSSDKTSAIAGKQDFLIFINPAQLNPPVQSFPLLGGENIVPSTSVVPPLNLTCYGNDYIGIGLAVDLSQAADRLTTYTKTEVDDIMQGKQNNLTCIDPMN